MNLPKSRTQNNSRKKLRLSRIIGINSNNNFNLAVNNVANNIAYSCGSTIVIYNPLKNQQTKFLNSNNSKPISCIDISSDGKYLSSGTTGNESNVTIWDTSKYSKIAELKGGHEFGISCLKFSPDSSILVSIGNENDKNMVIWDANSYVMISQVKNISKISAVHFVKTNQFVTLCSNQLKLWSVNKSTPQKIQSYDIICEPLSQGNYQDFVVGTINESPVIYVITKEGNFGIISIPDFKLIKITSINVKPICLEYCNQYILCSCANGIIKAYDRNNLNEIFQLPKINPALYETEYIESYNRPLFENRKSIRYPEAVICKIIKNRNQIVCVYKDKTIIVWDATNVKKIEKFRSFVCHAGPIWGIQSLSVNAKKFPAGTFVTCSSDSTIRFWNIKSSGPYKSAYSKELLKTILLKNDDETNIKVKCIALSPDCTQIASGDSNGILRIHSLDTFQQDMKLEAHEAEVLTIAYSESNKELLLASGGRDRLTHVFTADSESNYSLKTTLNFHSGSITSLLFNHEDKLYSSSADKSIICCFPHVSDKTTPRLFSTIVKGTIYDMKYDKSTDTLLTVGQGKSINIYNAKTGKILKAFKTEADTDVRIDVDPTGQYVAVASSDKKVRLYHLQTGQLISSAYGHSELITGIRFSSDLTHIITTSCDSCIYIWKLPDEVISKIWRVSKTRTSKNGLKTNQRNIKLNEEITKTENIPNWILENGSNVKSNDLNSKNKWTERIPKSGYDIPCKNGEVFHISLENYENEKSLLLSEVEDSINPEQGIILEEKDEGLEEEFCSSSLLDDIIDNESLRSSFTLEDINKNYVPTDLSSRKSISANFFLSNPSAINSHENDNLSPIDISKDELDQITPSKSEKSLEQEVERTRKYLEEIGLSNYSRPSGSGQFSHQDFNEIDYDQQEECYESADEEIEITNENIENEDVSDDRELDEYISNLENAFDQTVKLYRDLDEQNQISLRNKIKSFFERVQRRLEPIVDSQTIIQEKLLEKYSDMLIEIVKNKIEK